MLSFIHSPNSIIYCIIGTLFALFVLHIQNVLSEWWNSLYCPLATNHIVFAEWRNNSHIPKQLTWHKSFTLCNRRSQNQPPHDYSNREGPFLFHQHQHQCVPTKHFVHCKSSSALLMLMLMNVFRIFLLLFANSMKVYRYFRIHNWILLPFGWEGVRESERDWQKLSKGRCQTDDK